MYQTPDGLMEVRILVVTLTKKQKGDTDIVHQARIITFVNTTKKAPKQISLLTNDMELDPNDIILIYRKRWEIELLFKWKSHTNLTHAGKYFRPSKVKITSPTLPK